MRGDCTLAVLGGLMMPAAAPDVVAPASLGVASASTTRTRRQARRGASHPAPERAAHPA